MLPCNVDWMGRSFKVDLSYCARGWYRVQDSWECIHRISASSLMQGHLTIDKGYVFYTSRFACIESYPSADDPGRFLYVEAALQVWSSRLIAESAATWQPLDGKERMFSPWTSGRGGRTYVPDIFSITGRSRASWEHGFDPGIAPRGPWYPGSRSYY